MKFVSKKISVILFLLLAGCASAASARIWHVPGDAPTIQAGIDSAIAGDIVEIACGTYFEHDIQMSSAISLRSEDAESGCVIIDAQMKGKCLICSDIGATAQIEGIKFANAYTANNAENRYGGAIYIEGSGVVFHGCQFVNNRSKVGGGIAARYQSSIVLRDCLFRDNSAFNGWGGAAFCDRRSDIEAYDCRFENNLSATFSGGGVSCGSSTTICRFHRCQFTNNVAYHGNGGALNFYGHALEMTDCSIAGNTALFDRGGGLYCDGDRILIAGCIIAGNSASGAGGVHVDGNQILISGCIISENGADRDGAIYIKKWHLASDIPQSLSVEDCTIADNTAGSGNETVSGLHIHTNTPQLVSLTNTIIAFNRDGICFGGNGTVTFSCCNIFGNEFGDWPHRIRHHADVNGNFSADPLFCDPGNGDYSLRSDSPCLPGAKLRKDDCGLVGALGQGCWPDMQVTIDIDPKSDSHRVNCNGRSSIVKVAVLTTPDFDALTVDHTTVRFGPAEASEAQENAHGPVRREWDCDRDGDLDLLFHFRFNETGIKCGDTEAVLIGETYSGQRILGSDHIMTHRPGKAASDDYVEATATEVRPLALLQNCPNPFNPVTEIRFSLARVGTANLSIYSVTGRLIETLVNTSLPIGEHRFTWNGLDRFGRQVPSGVYFYKLSADSQTEVKRMLLVR